MHTLRILDRAAKSADHGAWLTSLSTWLSLHTKNSVRFKNLQSLIKSHNSVLFAKDCPDSFFPRFRPQYRFGTQALGTVLRGLQWLLKQHTQLYTKVHLLKEKVCYFHSIFSLTKPMQESLDWERQLRKASNCTTFKELFPITTTKSKTPIHHFFLGSLQSTQYMLFELIKLKTVVIFA